MKNVAGYDLMKLLTGSYGTLGIISQLTFRLFPRQDASKTVVIPGLASTLENLLARVRRSSLTPVALDLLSPALTERLGYGAELALVARFQSIAPGVVEQVETLLRMVPEALTAQVLGGKRSLPCGKTCKRAFSQTGQCLERGPWRRWGCCLRPFCR